MKNTLSVNTTLTIFVASIMLSCSQDQDDSKKDMLLDENYVDIIAATEIGKSIFFPADVESTLKNTNIKARSISSIDEVLNNNGKASFYVINYNPVGFVILSADKRTQPILAFSDDNSFIVDESAYYAGIKFWMDDANEQITYIQNSTIEQSPQEAALWERVDEILTGQLSALKFRPPPDDCYEHTEIYTKGPLNDIPAWHQNYPFNSELDFITCNGVQHHIKVGCIPLAMSMVMRYYEYPSSYSWSSMPLTSGASSTSLFIEDIHNEIDYIYQSLNNNWGINSYCNLGTTVSPGEDFLDAVFKDRFNFTSTNYANYNYSTVKSNLSYNRPVILFGDSSSGGGHAWVCSGYRTYSYYFDDCHMIGSLYLYMEWGFENQIYNGWYSYDNFNPGNTSYNSNKTMLYNIIP